MFLSGVILAAGASTRMGRPKQLLPMAGRPLLQCVLDEAAASCLDEIVVVLGHRADGIRAALQMPADRAVRAVVNPEHKSGLSSSLRCGLHAVSAHAAAVAILLADQPQVSATLIDRVAAAFRAADRPIVRPVYRDAAGKTLPGHPVFVARRLWPEIERLRGDQGLRSLLGEKEELVLEVPMSGAAPPDIDTWEDYERRVKK